MAKKEKTEKKVVNEQPKISIHKYSMEMKSMYKIRGLDTNEKLSYDEALEKISR